MAAPDPVSCPHCEYEIATYSEALEALEGGGRCLLCGGAIDEKLLSAAVDAWKDEDLLKEGEQRAEAEKDVAQEDSLFEGVPDFGDEGEDEEDPVL